MKKEEPVSKPIDFEKELYKAFGQVKDFTLGMRIAKWFYDMGKKSREPVSEEIEVSYEAKINEAHRLGREEGMFLAKTMFKEPVSEDLEEAAWFYADMKACLDISVFTQEEINKERSKFEYNWEDIRIAFKSGAQWQKKQKLVSDDVKEAASKYATYDGETISVKFPLQYSAFIEGALLQKEQMMAKAIDSRVYIDAGGYPYIPQIELYNYDNDVPLAKEGDKYKVVLIKEE